MCLIPLDRIQNNFEKSLQKMTHQLKYSNYQQQIGLHTRIEDLMYFSEEFQKFPAKLIQCIIKFCGNLNLDIKQYNIVVISIGYLSKVYSHDAFGFEYDDEYVLNTRNNYVEHIHHYRALIKFQRIPKYKFVSLDQSCLRPFFLKNNN